MMYTGPSNCWLRCRGELYQCHCISWRRRNCCLALEPKKLLLQPDWLHKLMDVICNFWDVHVIYIFVAISLMYDINIVYMYSFFFSNLWVLMKEKTIWKRKTVETRECTREIECRRTIILTTVESRVFCACAIISMTLKMRTCVRPKMPLQSFELNNSLRKPHHWLQS